jgi:hypothetical protein
MMEHPSLLTDLREFVMLHRVHGELQANASEPHAEWLSSGSRVSLPRGVRALGRTR